MALSFHFLIEVRLNQGSVLEINVEIKEMMIICEEARQVTKGG